MSFPGYENFAAYKSAQEAGPTTPGMQNENMQSQMPSTSTPFEGAEAQQSGQVPSQTQDDSKTTLWYVLAVKVT